MDVNYLKFGVSKKIFSIVVSFGVPVSVLLYLLVFNINEFLNFARLEKHGNTYQRPLEKALQYTQEYQLAFESGDTKMAPIVSKIDEAFSDWGKVNDHLGAELQFTENGLEKRGRSDIKYQAVLDRWTGLKKTVNALKKDDTAALAEASKLSQKIVADIRTAITHVGDTSNLILDPDLDSYYLMDVTLLALPQTQYRIGEIMSFGSKLAGKELSYSDKIQLAVYSAMLAEADLARVSGSTETSFNEDKNFYGASPTLQKRIQPVLNKYKEANEAFIGMTKLISESGFSKVDLQKWLEAGKVARNASFELWAVSDEELDTLLNNRIDFFDSRKMTSLLLAFLAIAFSVGLSLLVSKSITEPLVKAIDLMGPGAVLLSQCVTKISKAVEKNDHNAVSLMCEELSIQSDDMIKVVGGMEKIVHGKQKRAFHKTEVRSNSSGNTHHEQIKNTSAKPA